MRRACRPITWKSSDYHLLIRKDKVYLVLTGVLAWSENSSLVRSHWLDDGHSWKTGCKRVGRVWNFTNVDWSEVDKPVNDRVLVVMQKISSLDSSGVPVIVDSAVVLTMGNIRKLCGVSQTVTMNVSETSTRSWLWQSHHTPECLVLVSSVACVINQIAIKQSLLRQVSFLSVSDGVGSFNSSSRGESPATSTLTLSLDRGHNVSVPPVEEVWQWSGSLSLHGSQWFWNRLDKLGLLVKSLVEGHRQKGLLELGISPVRQVVVSVLRTSMFLSLIPVVNVFSGCVVSIESLQWLLACCVVLIESAK